MKNLEELKEMIKGAVNCCGDEEAKFLSLDLSDGIARLHPEYADAKRYAEQGGQVLVLANDKVYNYKVKTDDEYERYLANEIRNERYSMMNRYGL